MVVSLQELKLFGVSTKSQLKLNCYLGVSDGRGGFLLKVDSHQPESVSASIVSGTIILQFTDSRIFISKVSMGMHQMEQVLKIVEKV